MLLPSVLRTPLGGIGLLVARWRSRSLVEGTNARDEAEEVQQALAPLRDESGVMLFKGSRGCKMEQYYSFLERNWA